MNLLLVPMLLVLVNQPAAPGMHDLTLHVSDVGDVLYGLSIPRDYDPRRPVPYVLALHPGGSRIQYYGSAFTRQVIGPALKDLDPIIVAPDCPTAAWTDPLAERAVMALLASVLDDYAVDRWRILVTGFSLGGRGTWFRASRHSDLFTAAIPMAASTGDDPIDRLGTIPTYVIHSRDDAVVPFAPAEGIARQLEQMGRPVMFEALRDLGHSEIGGYVDALSRGGRWAAERWNRQAP